MLILVKYGGNAMSGLEADPVLADCAALYREDHCIVLVHGGGPAIDLALRERGIVEKRIQGMRVTGRASLDIVEATLCASVNKALVRALCAMGVPAAGISGEDGPTIVARPAPPIDGESLGYVGEIEEVRCVLAEALLEHRFFPVVAPLGVAADGSTAYNLNADITAGALAGRLGVEAYVVITDVPKIRRRVEDAASAVDRLSFREAQDWRTEGGLAGGMLPKVDGAFEALRGGAKRALVAGVGPSAIRAALGGSGTELSLQ
ncbi:MAG: acetylglutamate kinase [Candidatus Eremiobacteraeota bacterium]|nr:acetylglutamate kinase [Candidatus Eremiobacteraeota bacterium]